MLLYCGQMYDDDDDDDDDDVSTINIVLVLLLLLLSLFFTLDKIKSREFKNHIILQ